MVDAPVTPESMPRGIDCSAPDSATRFCAS
jgi:hypothetical protein